MERPRDSDPAEAVVVPKGPARGAGPRRWYAARGGQRFRGGRAKELTVKDGRFEAALDLPAKLPWPR